MRARIMGPSFVLGKEYCYSALAGGGLLWGELFVRAFLTATYRVARRIVIFVLGSTVLLIGAVMFFTPGPALLVIPAGLAILGLEFAWARRWLKHLKRKTEETLGLNKNNQNIGDKTTKTRSDQIRN